MQQRRRRRKQVRTLLWTDRAEIADLVVINKRCDPLLKVGPILDRGCDPQPPPGSVGDRDRFRCPLVGMYTPQDDQILTTACREDEAAQVDAVVNGRAI